jgi:hypothetical protein
MAPALLALEKKARTDSDADDTGDVLELSGQEPARQT